MKHKYIYWLWLGFFTAFVSCYEDKGNYDYKPLNELIIELPEEISVLANADTIQVIPVVKSSLEGEISPDDSNYSYEYRSAPFINNSENTGALSLMDSTYARNLMIPSKLKPGKYKCWLSVKDKRTEVVTSSSFYLNVASATREGWMVLCDEGANNRVRLDMIAIISDDRFVQTYDILVNDLPDLYQAYSLSFFPDTYNIDDYIYLLSGSGCYQLEPEELTSGPEYSMDYEFAEQGASRAPYQMKVTSGYRLIVDQDFNGYAMKNESGAIYELPVNTEREGESPAFKFSPYIAVDAASGNRCDIALLYDSENKRFMQWSENLLGACIPLSDPEDALFSYATGKEMVYMESTRNANGTAYALMKDNGGRYFVYGITFVKTWPVSKFKQQSYTEVAATDLDKATAFAFHSTLPYMFYAVGNKVYQYDLSLKQTKLMATYEKEVVTMLKFNLFVKNYWYGSKPDSYFDQQYDLIVGTQDQQAEEKYCGILRFYQVLPLNQDLELIGEPFRGFGKIRDVVYRERS